MGLAAINGSTIRNIGAVLPMETGLRQTDLVARLAETLWQIVRPVRGTRSAARAVMWAPTAAGQAASVELAELAARGWGWWSGRSRRIGGRRRAERTASAAAISRTVVPETGAASEVEVAVASMDPAPRRAAAAALRAWDLAEAVAVA